MKSPALLTRKKHKEHHLLPPSGDRRSTPRFEVEFRTLISDKSGINDQVGVILDLSLSGCHVRVPLMVYPTLVMELLIYAPDLDRPIVVEKAVVQVGQGRHVWSAFFEIAAGGTDSPRTADRQHHRRRSIEKLRGSQQQEGSQELLDCSAFRER